MAVPATPQRPLPGEYTATPAPARPAFGAPRPPLFPNPSTTSNAQAQRQSSTQQVPTMSTSRPAELTVIQRAARTINETLAREARFPELDNYITQGISQEYDYPPNAAWAPFQKLKTYDIPDRVFEQYNQAQVSTIMGLFAELNHAWVTIDNALYLWDYTSPNPELIGFEEQPNSITAVKLVKPRKGVFVDRITYLLLVATTADIFLIGVECTEAGDSVKQVALYQTKMQIPVRGIDVMTIAGSDATGRIFFGGRADDSVYEITYQQEDKWFTSKCGKKNHTAKGWISNQWPLGRKPPHEYVLQIKIDDTRNLLYTLSSLSTIKVFYMGQNGELTELITRSYSRLKTNISHMISRTDLLGPNTSIVAIYPISAQESPRLNLLAVTSTGCRVFLSAISGYYSTDPSTKPSSMQVQHVKFPPSDPDAPAPQDQAGGAYTGPVIDTNSKTLTMTRIASRFPPGYFLAFVQKTANAPVDHLFLSAPDSGRIARPQEMNQFNKYPEFGLWLNLSGRAEDIGTVTKGFGAASTPLGFGNELAVQFDQPATEIAILTNSGVETIRRRRLVDIFAAAIRNGGTSEVTDQEFNNFVRLYGRAETTSTALAVACGQGLETSEVRASRVTDQDILTAARRAFIEFGGKANYNENSVIDANANLLDNVRPSPRHEGIALYISRLVRSAWKVEILMEETTPTGGLTVTPKVPMSKIRDIQHDLTRLQEFLNTNRTFIEGLEGPSALTRVSTRQEEIALQGEHRALDSLLRMITNIVEGLAFVQVLFEPTEKPDEIILSLSDTSRQRVRQLTFEGLFASEDGKELAKELVKAIVNRNIASGSNVDTVADQLRRRCGSFCSPDDVVIFKAQEQINRAMELGANSENGRILLNESLSLFQRVAENLTMEHLQWAVAQYAEMEFYGGAIRLCLSVAKEHDRANQALAWSNEGRPQADKRRELFNFRENCYELILQIITTVDEISKTQPDIVDGQASVIAKRREEAYAEVNNSSDKLFQTHLFDWYMQQGWSDRLLHIDSEHVVDYLVKKGQEDMQHQDLLWRYFAHYGDFLQAARVQLELAKSPFDLNLDSRIQYLSQARANASTRISSIGDLGGSRQGRQELIREISDLLDVGSLQEELLQRLRADPRLTEQRKPEIETNLNGRILPIDVLYHEYADQAEYYDMCLLVYQIAAVDLKHSNYIEQMWRHLVEREHTNGSNRGNSSWEMVGDAVRTLGARLNKSETTFPVPFLIPFLYNYAFSSNQPSLPVTWVVDIFLDLGVSHELILTVLEHVLYNQEPPFHERRTRAMVAAGVVKVVEAWVEYGLHAPNTETGGVFGSEENAAGVEDMIRTVLELDVLDANWTQRARDLRHRIERILRRG